MIKKISPFFLSMLFLFSSINLTLAQTRINTNIQINTNTSNNSTDSQEILKQKLMRQDQIQELRRQKQAEIKARLETIEATREARLAEAKKKRIEILYTALSRRIVAASERLQRLIDRIESRLAQIEETDPDIDTESILLSLKEAENLVLEAQTDIESLNSVIDTILDSDDPKTAFEEVRETILDAKVKLVEAHRILASVIGDIKGLRVGQNSDNNTATESGVGE